jgi:predicted DNA-binding protein
VKTLEIEVPDEIALRIEAAANQLGVSVNQLLRSIIEDKLQQDWQFARAAQRVLEKNAELYRRLS